MSEWHLPKYAPDEYNLPWRKAAWSAGQYDENLNSGASGQRC